MGKAGNVHGNARPIALWAGGIIDGINRDVEVAAHRGLGQAWWAS